jgi:DAK2 domain fusion protein YloV
MALTMESVVAALAEVDASGVGPAIARGALLGARGASGVILSQLLGTLAGRLVAEVGCAGPCLAEGLTAAATAARNAVAHPVEGTILTVARAAGEAATAAGDAALATAVAAARDGAAAALAQTPDLLPVLRAAGVVDAGGAGFVLLLDALLHVVSGTPLPTPDDVEPGPLPQAAAPHARYEVVVHLAGAAGDLDGFRAAWEALGNESTVVVEGNDRWLAHVHTDEPEAALAAAEASGRVLDRQVTDLLAQVAELRTAGCTGLITALVAVVEGDGVRTLYRDGGATVIVAGGPARNPSTSELLDAVEHTQSSHVVILPNDRTIIPAAEQVQSLTSVEVAVVPTRTALEGLAALSGFDPDRDLESNVDALSHRAAAVRSGGVTRAVRDAMSAHGAIHSGDWLALMPDGLVALAATPLAAGVELLEALLVPGARAVTVLMGRGADGEVADGLVRAATRRRPALEVRAVEGGQPLYPYLIGVEVVSPPG